jgi:general secretion pathway protein A
MYERHFGFTVKPFALTPDPTFLYPSRQHAMALTMLEYGLESQAAFSLLTGDIGSGKTTLVRRLLRQLSDQVAVGLISNTHGRFQSIHGWALSALNIAPSDDSDIALYEALVDSFVREYAKGRRTLLIIDEAQNLSVEALEELRLLSNVNSEKDLILQILLVGQPELRSKLLRPELRQFAQRISVDFHLSPLDRRETYSYIHHRLMIAGGSDELFLPEAIELMHARTNGVPRLLNQLGDFALVYAYADGRTTIDADLIAQVVRDRGGDQSVMTFSVGDPAGPVGIANGDAA